ncbi:hypothetical protein [Lacibacter sp.]|uniref:hypothetical protein n=1 Tax=Lacibacter sp. TaxID=1915409 RepID=UPI002B4B4404|nr:hypothetical protein [Lacibacter sp.]HLP35965.1 hypothetical protein [Lacibacter sp.]
MPQKFVVNFILFFLLALNVALCQSNATKRWLKEQEEEQKKNFPAPLPAPYPAQSLGEKIQSLYELQAREACGIVRSDNRLYIPKEIQSGYDDKRLRTTFIYDLPISATNLLFLALTPSDITKITNSTFNEQEYVNIKRVIGLNDQLINFGQSVLTPISGFPSLFYQKSCGSYFVGDAGIKVKAPVAELEASLDAETKKTTSITTVTGNFFSPLYLILRQNTAQSVYAHLLIWEAYLYQYKNSPKNSEYLYEKGKYISEFKATLTNRAINSNQSINMNGRLSSNISLGVFSANGNINAGMENKVAFELRDFNTSIHKLSNGNLSWDLTNLPRPEEINQKLQNSTSFNAQPSMNGFASHLLPTEITRILAGVPASLCDKNSWQISPNGFNTNIWQQAPKVVSTHVVAKENSLPECICKITGFLRKDAIENAAKSNGFIELILKLNNSADIAGNKLSLDVIEPVVRVTDNPKVVNINSESINASRQEIKTSNKIQYNYPIQFIINSTGIKLTEPYKISNIQIEYVNKESENQLFTIFNGPIINGNTISLDVRTIEKPQNFIQEGQLIVAIKIKFNIEISGGTTTQLVTNTINLSLPNLVEKVEVKSNLSGQ